MVSNWITAMLVVIYTEKVTYNHGFFSIFIFSWSIEYFERSFPKHLKSTSKHFEENLLCQIDKIIQFDKHLKSVRLLFKFKFSHKQEQKRYLSHTLI